MAHPDTIAHRRMLRSFALLALAVSAGMLLLGSAVRAAESTPSPTPQGCAQAAAAKGAPAGTPVAGATCVLEEMHDIYFGANLITLPADTDVSIVNKNMGVTMHTFVIDEHNNDGVENLNIKVEVNPGESRAVTINAPAGTYYFYCDVPGHEQAGMWGILNVEEGATISAQSVDDPKNA